MVAVAPPPAGPFEGLPARTPVLRRGWLLLAAAALVLFAASVWWAGRLGQNVALADIRRSAATATTLHVTALRSEIEKQRALPSILAGDGELARVLRGEATPAGRQQIDVKLEDLARLTRAAVIYAMDASGLTVVSSNWSEPTSFVGQNYGFRPYFRDAITSGAYEQFALGTVSNRPGLYLSRAVVDERGIAGVVAVKLEFEAIETEWRQGSERTYVVDRDGIVVVTDWPGWRFRTVAPLDDDTARRVQAEFRIGRPELAPLPVSSGRDADLVAVTGGGLDGPALHLAAAVPGTAWTLHTLTPVEPALERAAWQARTIAGLASLLVAAAAGLWLAGRNRQVQRARRQEFVRQELEQRVAERTHELSETNARLETEVEERRRTETALRQLGDELVQANKLATMGQIAASVAHEVNQPLAAIRSYADNAAVLIDRGRIDDARGNLGSIATLTDRIGKITQELRGFARKTAGVVEPVSLVRALEGSLLLVEHRVRRQGVALDLRVPSGDVTVLGETVRIEQVIVNLLQNALDAVSAMERPIIAIDVREETEAAVLTVTDNGSGLPGGEVDVFTPFVTTKADGLGLGLAICRDILKDFGAGIAAAHAPHGGACFVVTFRRAGEGA